MMPPTMAPPQSAGVPQQSSGLLGQSAFDISRLTPPQAFVVPRVSMTSGMLSLGARSSPLERLLPSMLGESDLASPLKPFQAGLQPYIAPAGTPWQEEVIYDRIAKTDAQIQAEMMYYFNAAQAYDTGLRAQRMQASDYYNARAFGDEERGRSHLVLSTVRDTIRATLPSLLRVFTAVENPVEFVPSISDNEQLGLMHAELARQATEYARWALFTANDGWMVLHDAMLDALTRKIGWVRWYWGQQRAQRVEDCDRLLLPQLQYLLQEPGITAQRVVRRPMLPNEQRAVAATPEGAAYLQAGGPPVFYAARITRSAARAWPIVEAVPSECIWLVSDAETVGNARAVFHVRDVPASDLISAGLPADKVMKATQQGITHRKRQEAVARDPISGSYMRGSPPNDQAMRLVRYIEGWCKMDTDGDGIAELVHTHAVGFSPQLCRWDRTDEIPVAGFTPYREPGRVIGFSQADMVADLQRTETRVMRAILDSLGQSIFPRTVVQVGQVNLDDARQTAVGAIIRVSQQGAVQELAKPFVGAQALPVMESLEAVRESRTGITRTSQGLTAESLQSTAPLAVAAQTGAAQDRLDMMARTLAETGLVPLYQGLLRMMARKQDRPNVLSIRGKWVTIDPRALNVIWAMQINIGGRGTPTERVAMLNAIAAKQEQILAPAVQAGRLDTPLVGLPEYRNTLARMCEAVGISDVVSYFKELPANWQPPPPPPQPSTDQVLAQVEAQKTQADIADSAGKRETDRIKTLMEDDRARDEAALQAWTSAYSTGAQHGTPVPSIDEFKKAMKAGTSRAALLTGGTGPQGAGPQGAGAQGAGPQGAGGIPSGGLGGQPAPGATGGPPPRGGGPPFPTAVTPPPGAVPSAPGQPGRVASLPVAAPPVATPAGATTATDPATMLAMRRAMLQGGGNAAGMALGNRALLGPQGPAGG